MARFVNPYNFIPLGMGNADKRSRQGREEVYCSGAALKSGWIDVSMLVKTPLIVPDGAHPEYYDVETDRRIKRPTEEEKKEAHKKYLFYHVEEDGETKYIVPGSELRGMIRSVYEAVTDSCFPFLLNDKPIGQRVPAFGSFQNRGLLEYNKKKEQWSLWDAHAERKKCDVKGDGIYLGKTEYKCGEYIEGRGYVQCNNPVSNRDNYHIAFLKVKGEKPLFEWTKGDEEPYRMLKYALTREDVKGNQNNPNKKQGESLKKCLDQVRKAGGKVPVWFFKVKRGDETLIYLSNSSIGRVAQRRKWEDVFAAHKPCDDMEHLCPACMLFGTINGEGMKGRVRFSDAECEAGTPKKEACLLDILGEPRTSAFEFYLRRPEGATYWNFDFYGHKILDKYGRSHNEYLDLAAATPRGRKMYWHGKPVEGTVCTKMNATMEGVAADTRFKFKIYFDQIIERQLQDLIWVISLGENTEDGHMLHKLGHARPLGYGSVKLCVEQYHVRELFSKDGDISVEVKHYPADEHPVCNFDTSSSFYKSIIAMCDAGSVEGKEVRYPRSIKENKRSGKKDDSIYQWFANNRKNADKLKTLPEPTGRDITLEGSWLRQDNGGRKQGGVQPREHDIPKNSNTCTGTIKALCEGKKGPFGFISYNGQDYYFDSRDLWGGLTMKSIKKEDQVCFEIGIGKNGPVAKKVRIL